jgi:hypothetical protein
MQIGRVVLDGESQELRNVDRHEFLPSEIAHSLSMRAGADLGQ